MQVLTLKVTLELRPRDFVAERRPEQFCVFVMLVSVFLVSAEIGYALAVSVPQGP